MRNAIHIGLVVAAIAAGGIVQAFGGSTTFSPFVDQTGAIALPDPATVRARWASLGTWVVSSDDGVEEFHSVYTQPHVVDAFRASGEFPDAAVLIKEVREAETRSLTTGEASSPAAMVLWFVMVKDREERFPDNPLWGKGWGWALFHADEPATNAAEDYKLECMGCHVPARKTDWIYSFGYPVLRDE